MQTHRIATLVPLAVGVPAVVCTIVIHALPLSATVNLSAAKKDLVARVRVSGLIWESLRWSFCMRLWHTSLRSR